MTDRHLLCHCHHPQITDATAWQPLIDSNDLGFFYAQEHVTPHIGTTARPVVLTQDEHAARTLDSPNYDYELEAGLAVAQVASLDDFKKAMVEFMVSAGVLDHPHIISAVEDSIVHGDFHYPSSVHTAADPRFPAAT